MALIFANKAALKAAVVSWLADGSLADETLERAIALCEAGIRRKLRTFQMEVTTELTVSQETLTFPSRFVTPRRLYLVGHRPLRYLSPELLVDDQIDHPTPSRPLRYTMEGREDALGYFRFSPVPDIAYTLRLTYLADSALLSDLDCNAVLESFPDVYHYGTLVHLGDYVRNKERLPDWQSKYEKAIAGIIDADLTDKTDGSTLTPRTVYRGA